METQVIQSDAGSGNSAGRGPSPRVEPFKVDPDTYYPEVHTAAFLGRTLDTLRRKRQTGGGIPYLKFGRQVFYAGRDIIAALEATRRLSTREAQS